MRFAQVRYCSTACERSATAARHIASGECATARTLPGAPPAACLLAARVLRAARRDAGVAEYVAALRKARSRSPQAKHPTP